MIGCSEFMRVVRSIRLSPVTLDARKIGTALHYKRYLDVASIGTQFRASSSDWITMGVLLSFNVLRNATRLWKVAVSCSAVHTSIFETTIKHGTFSTMHARNIS
jgi:hypothetical protein